MNPKIKQDNLALHAEVVDVVTRYASGIDRRDWALFRSAFADDAKVDYGPFMGSWETGDDFTAFMRESHSPAGLSVRRMTNIVITGTGTGTGTEPLTARTYGDALLQHRDDPATVDHSAGYYDDVFVRTEEGLKIASRTRAKHPGRWEKKGSDIFRPETATKYPQQLRVFNSLVRQVGY